MPNSELYSENDHGISPGTRVKSRVHFVESRFNILVWQGLGVSESLMQQGP
jgi:hypothetical protein